MTIDLEEWFHGLTSTGRRPETWGNLESRIDVGTDFLLSLFEETGIKATFFTVGVLAEQRPDIIKRIAEAGHEIGMHSQWHRHLRDLDPEAFAADLRSNREAIKAACNAPVYGFRAPAFSVKTHMSWVWDKIEACGLSYSSSLFPIRTPLYGAPDAPISPHRRGGVIELPMSVFQLAGQHMPFSGGFYFRALPYMAVQRITRMLNARGEHVIFYFHPWEFDPDHPMPMGMSRREKLSHYSGLNNASDKLARLCRDFQFAPLHKLALSVQ